MARSVGVVRQFIVAAPILLCAFLFAGPAPAAGLAVAPLSLVLQAGEQATSVIVTNRDDHPWVIQADVKRWTQPEGHDQYQPDPNLLATPALFRIPSQAKQVVRVGFTGGPAQVGDVEQAFRLFIAQVPPEQSGAGSASQREPAGVQFLLHLVLPVFLPPAHPHPRSRWSLEKAGGKSVLRLYNEGNVHLRVIEVSATDAAGRAVFDERGLWYVLAGAYHDWLLPAAAGSPGGLHVRARTEGTTLSAHVASGQ